MRDGKMILNDAGLMIEKWYNKLPNKYPNTKCNEKIIMPNHFHFIIEIIDILPTDGNGLPPTGAHVGAPVGGTWTPVTGKRASIIKKGK
ncbi:MAG: hypothetical protein U9O87_03335 [Verrucomicrobiota bacterium]|nr:hypothetical protein [Verrucomicrobiota bacterium]